MAAPQASSRLEMLQARFQQKQLQEKEQKLLQLYDQQQQRAYQVVQRGSAGSNGSNHGSNHGSVVSQQTVTRTSSTSHTTSTSQGGKVRQMFDERRQTSVKGIDRSYPLEPLDNKPRKQLASNGVGSQRNNNVTVNRHSVTVKRVARADVNSNVNDGKPVVSYHEEITRESFGPALHHQEEEEEEEEDEFGNENHVGRYANGNQRDESSTEAQVDEILDKDTIERNRMMAKIHLMQYDETMKHRVRNDLESEQFPEEYMIDVPDRIPKRTLTKKLSQAEARLERFKNSNAKKNSISKSTGSMATVTKKRTEPTFTAKSNPRIAKSPSPDPMARKSGEMNVRATTRRSVPSSPSKIPDIVPGRSSVETKSQESRLTKRSQPAKGADSIGGRRTSAATTVTTKSCDTIDGVLENGLQGEHHTVETKYENETTTTTATTTKKSDAFVIDLDEQASKENDSTHSKKPPPRKQLSEKYHTSSVTAARPTSSVSSISSGSSAQGQSAASAKGRMATRAKTPTSGTTTSKGSPLNKSGASMSATDNLVPCKVCSRRFARERVALHEQICAKTVQKKRKQFDTMMYRVRGTDLEPFVKKGTTKKLPESKSKKTEVKSNWRRKHEDFINAIRSAKQVQAHLAAGGKLSDLPPPPASDTSDYIQCPHCGRKFNQAAAERHIPKCEHMLHNKPAHARGPSKLKR